MISTPMAIRPKVTDQVIVYEIEPTVRGRVGPDPQLQPQVDLTQGPKARGLFFVFPKRRTRYVPKVSLSCLRVI